MLHSPDRILTTHVRSLPGSETVTKMVFAGEKGERMDPAGRHALLSKAVDAIVAPPLRVSVSGPPPDLSSEVT